MKRAILFESGALLLLGVTGFVGGLRSLLASDSRTQSSSLKPGMYVMALAAALVLTALVYGFLALRKEATRADTPGSTIAPEAWTSRIVLLVLGAVAVYAFLIPVIGYLPSTLLFLVLAFRLLGVESWWRNLAMTAITATIFYVLFVHYGEIVFPHASLFE